MQVRAEPMAAVSVVLRHALPEADTMHSAPAWHVLCYHISCLVLTQKHAWCQQRPVSNPSSSEHAL